MLLNKRVYKLNIGENLIVIEGKLSHNPPIHKRYIAKISYSREGNVCSRLCKIPYEFIESCYTDNMPDIQICRYLERFRIGSHISDIVESKSDFYNPANNWSLFKISHLKRISCIMK